MKEFAQHTPLGIETTPSTDVSNEKPPPYCIIHLPLHTTDHVYNYHLTNYQQLLTDMMLTSISRIVQVFCDTMHFKGYLNTTTARLSLDSTNPEATFTPDIHTAANTTTATITVDTTFSYSLDITTI